MVPTLLVDLDDTLLGNSMESFVPAYIQTLTTRLSVHADQTEIARALLKATRLMVENNRPDCTLMEVFDSSFYPALGFEKNELQATIDRFYAEDFPKLKHLTQYKPEAVELIKEALQRSYQVGIATNPLFPRTAIEQRLAWAGLPVEDFPFIIVPSYDLFHFAKPNPAYFAEFLGQMGWPDAPVIMVGNDPEKDILAAQKAGLSVFWSVASEDELWYETQEIPPRGKLEAFFNWLDSVPQAELVPKFNTPSAMVAVLRSTPAVLDILCADHHVDSWVKRPEPEEWCPTEILCHLRDVEVEVNLPRIEKMLQEVNPFIPGKDTDPWAVERDYIRQDGPNALHDFTAYRQKLLFILDNLSADAWKRPARHAFFGPTNLTELVGILAEHDRLHIRQTQETFKQLNEPPPILDGGVITARIHSGDNANPGISRR